MCPDDPIFSNPAGDQPEPGPAVEKTIGSQFTPDMTKLRELVQAISDRLECIVRAIDRPLHERHNAFVAYMGLLLLSAGLRPVRDFMDCLRSVGQGYVGVEEKVMTRGHGYRVLALPTAVWKQLMVYLQHLESLAAALLADPKTAPMGKAVLELRDGTTQEGRLPLLFFLNADCDAATGISEATLLDRVSEWIHPLNYGRHLLATGLHRLDVPAWQIRFQLGHLMLGETQVGAESIQSLTDILDALRGPLDEVVWAQGWRVMPGPLAATERPAVSGSIRAYVHGLLGPAQRAARRAELRRETRDIVREVIRGTTEGEFTLDDTTFERAHSNLLAVMWGVPEQGEFAERVLWRFARRNQDRNHPLTPPERFVVVGERRPSFWVGQPYECELATRLRSAFLDHLCQRHRARDRDGKRPSTTSVQRCAEVLVSACLYGAMFDRDRLKALSACRADDLIDVAGVVALEWKSEDGRKTTRWAWDGLTAALLSNPGVGETPSARELAFELRRLLRLLAPELNPKNPFEMLASLGRAYWRTHASGFLWSFADGATVTTPMRPGTLTRVLTNLRLKMDAEEALSRTRRPTRHIVVGAPGSLTESMRVKEALDTAINEVTKARAAGHTHSKASRMKAFRKHWLSTFRNWQKDPPPIAAAIAEFAYHLARCGTPEEPRLEISSLRRYLTALAPLYDEGYDVQFQELNGNEYELLYRRVLATRSTEEAPIFGRCLLEFHRFLTEIWGVEEPDWSFLPGEVERDANANLVTDLEYRRALKMLYSDRYATDRERVRQAALLVLGYRFGLRAGEAVRLRYADLIIEFDISRVVVDIGANIYGHTKSLAGVRRVWLLGELDDMEQEVLTRLKKTFVADLKDRDPRAGLFAAVEDPRACIVCRRLFERISEALKLVTGDMSLRFHHLRHSFGTRLLLCLTGDRFESASLRRITKALCGTDPNHAEIRERLTGDRGLSPLTLQALTDALGHTSVQTTIQSYVHVMDLLLQAECERLAGTIPVAAWAQALGEDIDTVRRRLARCRAAEVSPSPFAPRWPEPVNPPVVATLIGRVPDVLPERHLEQGLLPLRLVAKIRGLALGGDKDSDEIAATVQVPEPIVAKIMEAAQDLDGIVGPKRGITLPIHRYFGVPELDLNVIARWKRQESRLIKGLMGWDETLMNWTPKDVDLVEKGRSAWISAKRHVQGRWVFLHPDPLSHLLSLLVRLDVPLDGFTYKGTVASGFRFREPSPLWEALANFEVKVTSDDVPPDSTRLDMHLAFGKEPFKKQYSFDRALEMLFIRSKAQV